MKPSTLGRVYNWRPDRPDHRDFKFSRLAPPTATTLSAVDLRPLCPPVVDQGDIGSCTANSLSGALGFLELMELKAKIAGAQVYASSNGQYAPASRLFIYYNERSLEGDVSQDSGAALRDGIRSLAQLGVCREQTWQYSDGLVFQKPTPLAFSEASQHKISSYYGLNDLSQVKQCLATGFPVAFGFTVFESFESTQTARSGVMTMPTMWEQSMGGHAVLAVGYDDKQQHLIVRNSWGTSWGDKGYFYMPYAYFTPDLTSDYWTIRR